jgi:hypothetical protein
MHEPGAVMREGGITKLTAHYLVIHCFWWQTLHLLSMNVPARHSMYLFHNHDFSLPLQTMVKSFEVTDLPGGD